MTDRGNCGSWNIWLHQRAQMVYGQHYAANKAFDFLPEDHWFRRQSRTDEQKRAAKTVSEFMQICNECGCDVIMRQHTDGYDKHERYNAEQLVISSGSEMTDSERNY